jgi:hypothetical protein
MMLRGQTNRNTVRESGPFDMCRSHDMSHFRCLVCRAPVDTIGVDRCGDCREVESRNYAGWWDSEGVTDEDWLDAQSVDQTVRADIAETPSDEEVAAEDARYYSPPVFMTMVYAEYEIWRAEWNASKTPVSVSGR